MDEELYTLIKIAKELGLDEEIAKELGIKKESVRRQLNRLEAFIEGREAQSRSGRRKGEEYKRAITKAIEKETGAPIRTDDIKTPRVVEFDKLKDAMKYSEPIRHISRMQYDRKRKKWRVKISPTSIISPYQL
jgi:transcription initiation factor IIE alpha subunit